MTKRAKILAGMAAGLVWAVALVAGARALHVGFMPINVALIGAFTGPGLFMLALIGRLAQRRFFDDTIIDGQDFTPGSPAWVDQRVLSNTAEQIVLALALWPFVALVLGGVVALALGVGFTLTRLAFWVGYHIAPPLRAFGFAASFYPTVVATVWAVLAWAF